MRKKISAIIFVAFASFAQASESTIAQASEPTIAQASEPTMIPYASEKKSDIDHLNASVPLKTNLIYVRFMATEPNLFATYTVDPGFGFGYRHTMGRSAFDIFVSGGLKGREYIWTAPKVSYIHYLEPTQNQSMYFGAGLGFGGVEQRERVRKKEEDMTEHEKKHAYDRKTFVGLIVHGTVGVELCRREACVIFTELSLSQPIIPTTENDWIPGPNAEVAIGFGF